MQVRNLCVIAHVDHGKTSLTDKILKQVSSNRGAHLSIGLPVPGRGACMHRGVHWVLVDLVRPYTVTISYLPQLHGKPIKPYLGRSRNKWPRVCGVDRRTQSTTPPWTPTPWRRNEASPSLPRFCAHADCYLLSCARYHTPSHTTTYLATRADDLCGVTGYR
jgi:hypothetical protein